LKKLSLKRKLFLIKNSLKGQKRRKKKYFPSDFALKVALSQNPEFKEIWAPQKLTLKFEDSRNVLELIKNIKKNCSKGYFIYLRLDNVEIIAEGAIAMLLSVISDLEHQNIFFKGEKPKSESAKNILESSGFFRHMNGSISKKNNISKNKILKTGNKNTNQKELTPEIHKAMETIWGVEARCPYLYGGIGEMMRNSCDHAFTNKKQIMWHLGISHFESEKSVKFSFVDNGSGILNTYNKKGLIKKIVDFFSDDADILDAAFKNGIESRTGLSWRGKGLPTIFEMYEDEIVTNLVVITNKVYLDFDRKIIKTIPVEFSGTYYFWVINNTCKPAYFKI
jgi:hypothetical protein